MILRLTAWALAALPAAACLSIPPYDPLVKVTYGEDNTGAKVFTSGFELHFPTGDHFRFPDQLTFDGNKVLGNDMSAPCFDVSAAGIQLAPSFRISGDSSATGAMIAKNELRPVLRGPAVVQIALDWATQLGITEHRPNGTSTFTVFLDGRIVRHDVVNDTSMAAIIPAECMCRNDAPPIFNIASYWAFDRNALTAAQDSTVETADRFDQKPQPVSSPLPSDLNGQVFACFGTDAYQVASAQRIPGDVSDAHQFLFHSTSALLALTYYQVATSPVLGDFPWEGHSAVFLEHGGCSTAFKRAQEYLADPPSAITVNRSPVALSANDGIYGGDVGDGSAPGIKLTTDRAEISGTVASSFAVWLSFPHAVDLVRATFQGGPAPTGAWYIPQQVDSRTWIFWFRDPLADLQTITIAPD